MILEGIVTTLSDTGELNVAPMGPIVDPSMSTLLLRPFNTSTTYANLRSRPYGVFHVTDDVLLLAQAAVGRIEKLPETISAERINGRVIANTCRWYEFEVVECDESAQRTRLAARVLHMGRVRDYFGLNRAKHAVVEAAILATRVQILDRTDVFEQFDRLRSPVEKTAGPDEAAAFAMLENYVRDAYAD